MHVNQTLGRCKWTKSFIDWLCGLWTNAGGFTMNCASPVSHRLTPDPPVSDHSDHLGDLTDHLGDHSDHLSDLTDHLGDLSDHLTS